ncbi:MAG: polysulfide reductase NrfD [Elusimicrobia bacterium]|nr:polysulfide reductase NrfD [Elusimicrobiota bacterium]
MSELMDKELKNSNVRFSWPVPQPEEVHDVESEVLKPITNEPTTAFYATTAILATVFLAGVAAWAWQIINGLKVTGLNVPVFWGLYIVNFVFFIGVSHAGTLISAILRITDAAWRTPFTRVAESITIASLPFAASSVIVDLGRPDRFLNVILYPHLTSPILWDVLCISTYLLMSCLYFYIALVPDIALCRDRLTGLAAWRSHFYRLLALDWQGTPQQKRLHHQLMSVLSILLLALVISVHTNVGFIFGMTTKPGWHSAAIGPYFVVGAAFQGLGGLAAIIVLVRRWFHLEWIITEERLAPLKKFFLAVACFWAYFTLVEFLTTYYGRHTAEMEVFWAKLTGEFWLPTWGMLTFCLFIPLPLLALSRWRITTALLIAGISVNIGMWLERYTIVVPSGARPYLSWGIGHYNPSWVEWTITAGWFAGFCLFFLVLTRLFPILTVWEVQEEKEGSH